jgi:hypothetical protein
MTGSLKFNVCSFYVSLSFVLIEFKINLKAKPLGSVTNSLAQGTHSRRPRLHSLYGSRTSNLDLKLPRLLISHRWLAL